METPTSGPDRRRTPRSEIYYPIRFRLFSRDIAVPPMDGCLKDISLEGARVGVDDRYGQFAWKSLKGIRTKLQITLPESDSLQLICEVCWARRSRAGDKAELDVGLKFAEVEPWQLEKIRHFLSLRHTDQTMLWNLWDSYQRGGPQQP